MVLSARSFVASAAVAVAGLVTSPPTLAAVPTYGPVGTLTLPSSDGAFDVGADGRVVAVDGSGLVRRQSTPTATTFDALGSLPSSFALPFGPGLASLSPDGTSLAVGDNDANGRVIVVTLPATAGSGELAAAVTVSVNNYAAAWAGGSTLYVSGGFGATSRVSRVDLGPTPQVQTVITNIGGAFGAPGDVRVRGGRVYAGIGFGAGEGEVRWFDLAALNSASGGVAFSTGTFAATAFTAATIDFDPAGNLIISGQSFSSPNGVAIIDPATLMRADLPGLDPAGAYSARFNAVTGEILVRAFGSATITRYAIPAPSAAGVLAIGALLAARRRRAGVRS